MSRLLRLIVAVGVSLISFGTVTASDYYFGTNYDNFPQQDRREFGCSQCQTCGNPGRPTYPDRFGCAGGACFRRDGGDRFGVAQFPFEGSQRAIPNRPPVRNYPELGLRPRLNRAPLNQPPQFLSQPILSEPSLRPLAEQELIIPPKQKGIANLPPAEQKVALKQRICPVTRDLLGSMGTPISVQVGGRSIYVCCQGCVETLLESPSQYLPKLQISAGRR